MRPEAPILSSGGHRDRGVRAAVCLAAIYDAYPAVKDDHHRVGIDLRQNRRWCGVVRLCLEREVQNQVDYRGDG